MPGSMDGTQAGLSWSWSLDFDALLAALNEPAPWNRPPPQAPAPAPVNSPPTVEPAEADPAEADPAEADPAEADPAEADPAEADRVELDLAGPELTEAELDAMERERGQEVPLTVVAGRIAESLPTGPDLAGWLATSSVADLEDGALAGMAASYRRLASWAQAGELAVIAELASRSAAADDEIGVDGQRRPVRLPDEACAQVSLALTMSHASASWWSDLAVTLTWRLPATGAALTTGQIDLGRARLIAEATAALDEETARAVEAKVLPAAGDKTTAQLRATLRRAVIAADPQCAERRREEAERRAKVSLYPDQDGTASLAGYSLPSIRAAAAMARITALARAMKAAGVGGSMDLLRAQVFLGLLLGTLPYIPPAADGPPDPPPGAPPDDYPEEPPEPGEPPESGEPPQPGRPAGNPRGEPTTDQPARTRRDRPKDGAAGACPPSGSPAGPAAGSAGAGFGVAGAGAAGSAGADEAGRTDPGTGADHGHAHDPPSDDPASGSPTRDGPPRDDPARAGPACGQPESGQPGGYAGDDRESGWGPPPAWPGVGAATPPGPAAMGNLAPVGGGLVDVELPWSTLAGDSGEPGHLSRIGPITPAQARYLADLAAGDAAVQWRVIVAASDGRAEAVTRVPAVRGGTYSPGQSGPVRRVTLTISADDLGRPPAEELPPVLRRAHRVALFAAECARQRAELDAAAVGGCAHEQESPGYRPPPRLREYVTARDVTCRFLTCRQPVWRCDLDHSVPYDQGGRTCSCNLGGLCRFHHQLKQHRRWRLAQPVPGTFTWTTPAGRAYLTEPDRHAA